MCSLWQESNSWDGNSTLFAYRQVSRPEDRETRCDLAGAWYCRDFVPRNFTSLQRGHHILLMLGKNNYLVGQKKGVGEQMTLSNDSEKREGKKVKMSQLSNVGLQMWQYVGL